MKSRGPKIPKAQKDLIEELTVEMKLFSTLMPIDQFVAFLVR